MAKDADADARHRYATYFSSRRLRELALTRHGSNHDDLWQGVELVLGALGSRDGEPRLGLPGLGGLFTVTEADVLAGSRLPNTALLVRCARPSRSSSPRVSHAAASTSPSSARRSSARSTSRCSSSCPATTPISHAFSLEMLAGNDRKTSGSYYTPSELVELVLDTALDPVLDDVEKRASTPEERAAALSISRCATPRSARPTSLLPPPDGSPCGWPPPAPASSTRPPPHYSDALHDVVARCLYGVDVNPMAADLAKVSLWLTAMTPGKPLSFLDHHIKVGNALLGTTPALLAQGIPNAAFVALTGDDKATVSAWKKANTEDRKHRGQGDLFGDAGIVLDTTATRQVVGEVATGSQPPRRSTTSPGRRSGTPSSATTPTRSATSSSRTRGVRPSSGPRCRGRTAHRPGPPSARRRHRGRGRRTPSAPSRSGTDCSTGTWSSPRCSARPEDGPTEGAYGWVGGFSSALETRLGNG